MAVPDLATAEIMAVVQAISRGSEGDRHAKFLEDQRNFFAHYTSVDTLKSIAEGRGFYLRNTRLMNDHSEVRHGFHLLNLAFEKTSEGAAYVKAWGDVFSEAAIVLRDVVSYGVHNVANNCFVLSICEHHEPEDAPGKLSMWRAYGSGDIRVAVIARPKPLLQFSTAGVLLTPVVYGDLARVQNELAFRANMISQNAAVLKKLQPDVQKRVAAGLTVNLGVSIKHPGFLEEQEWRFVYMPDFGSDKMNNYRQAVVLGGVPQIVYKLPIILPIDKEYKQGNLFLEKLILGPCAESETVLQGLIAVVESFGFANAADIISSSGIPYRQRI